MLGRSRDEMDYSAINEDQEEEEEEEVERSSYYGGASMPFIWETRPGTPKHNLFSTSSLLPRPLAPPPSYFSSSSSSSTPKQHRKVKIKLTKFLSMSMFHSPKKSNNTMTHDVSKPLYSWSSSSSSSYVSSSSSSSFSSSPLQNSLRKPVSRDRRCFLSCSKRSVSYTKDKEEDDHGSSSSSPTMTLCYSSGGRNGFTCSLRSAFFSLLGNKTKP